MGTKNIGLTTFSDTVTFLSPPVMSGANIVASTVPAEALTNGSAQIKVSTTNVDLSIGTKQTLYTVPEGKSLVVTHVISRQPNTAFTDFPNGSVGYDSSATNVIPDLSLPGGMTTNQYWPLIVDELSGVPAEIGNAGDVLGFQATAMQAATTLTIDVFGYFLV